MTMRKALSDWFFGYATKPYFSKLEGIGLSMCGTIIGMGVTIKNIAVAIAVMATIALVVNVVGRSRGASDGK